MRLHRFLGVAILFALPLFFITCDEKDEVTPRPYPSVKTHPVNEITSEAVTFDGELVSLSDGVIDHGFYISQSSTFPSFGTEKVSLGAASKTGLFKGTLDQGMQEDIEYYARAYAKSKSHEVLGNVVKFKSLGSKAPELFSISPATGTWGDQIVLKGTRFTTTAGRVIVKFDDIAASVQSVTKDSIVCIVPASLHNGPSTISVSVFGNVSKLVDAFQLKKPEVNSVTPQKAYPGTQVVITGKYFRIPKSEVLFGDVPAVVTKSTATQIEFTVPKTPQVGAVNFTVKAGTGNIFTTVPFEIFNPTVTDFSPKVATYRNTITITGQSLNPDSEVTRVKFGNVEAPVISITSTEIKVNVPDNLAGQTNVLSVTTEAGTTVFDELFRLFAPQITSVLPSDPLIVGDTEITISGNYFAYTGNVVTLGDKLLSVQSEDPTKIVADSYGNTFTEHNLDLTVTTSGQSVTIDNAFYCEWINRPSPQQLNGSKTSLLINNELYFIAIGGSFFHYDQQENIWNSRESAPVFGYDQFTFSVNGKGYVGGGTYNGAQRSKEFYEYDPSTNQWTRNNDVPFDEPSFGFDVNNIAYTVTSTGVVWRYNTTLDSWIEMNNVAQNLVPNKGFIHNFEFYGLTSQNHLVKYDQESDSWQQLAAFPDSPSTFLFALNGRLYFKMSREGGISSFNLNALDEKSHHDPIGEDPVTGVSIAGKAFVISWSNAVVFYLFTEFKPY